MKTNHPTFKHIMFKIKSLSPLFTSLGYKTIQIWSLCVSSIKRYKLRSIYLHQKLIHLINLGSTLCKSVKGCFLWSSFVLILKKLESLACSVYYLTINGWQIKEHARKKGFTINCVVYIISVQWMLDISEDSKWIVVFSLSRLIN